MLKKTLFQPLSEKAIASILKNASSGYLLGSEEEQGDLRLSLVGAQEKTVLLWHEEQWYRTNRCNTNNPYL